MKHFIFLLLLFFSINLAIADFFIFDKSINWKHTFIKSNDPDVPDLKLINFDYSSFDNQRYPHLPLYTENINVPFAGNYSAKIINAVYENVAPSEIFPGQIESIPFEHEINTGFIELNNEYIVRIDFLPLIKDPNSEQIKKLISFSLKLTLVEELPYFAHDHSTAFNKRETTESVLANGKWYKIGVSNSGIYKLDYDFLESLGMNLSGVNPEYISIYGNGGGMLPELNTAFRHEDMQEIAIFVKGEANGTFDKNDYILFYAEGPTKWSFSNNRFKHQIHYYSDTTYYFITASKGKGKRINSVSSLNNEADLVVTSFDELLFHEKDLFNDAKRAVKSGREWYGEEFNIITNRDFNFNIPNLVKSEKIYMYSNVGVRSLPASRFIFSVNDEQVLSLQPDPVDRYYTSDYFKISSGSAEFNSNSDNLTINLAFEKNESAAVGWLNFIGLNARRELIFNGSQMAFRDSRSVGENKISEFRVSNHVQGMQIWDLTDFHNVYNVSYQTTGTYAYFRSNTSNLKEFVILDPSKITAKPYIIGKVDNQNLHGLGPADYVIVTYPGFMSAAKRLADFHREYNNFRVQIVTPQQIYNEFSSGAQDVSAIRDFMKMFYDRANSVNDKPKYLLLFGSSSYDPKNRVSGNSNYIVSYQSVNSHSYMYSFVSDDYFGFLIDGQGQWNNNSQLVVSVGRLPVRNLISAHTLVDKIISYHNPESFGPWRNRLTFIADDQDPPTGSSQKPLDFTVDSESIVKKLENNYKVFNIRKIYADSYEKQNTPSGGRFPGVNEAINRTMDDGSLIINFIGHGGEVGWTEERILTINDINSWNNYPKLPIFITATCEFSRFDDPERVSAGELVLLNENGGSIAMLSTTRLVGAYSNIRLLESLLHDNFFEIDESGVQRLGDVFINAKNIVGTTNSSAINFSLLGDPALVIAFPKERVITTAINNKNVDSTETDTIKALELVTVSGMLTDQNGNKLEDFNGYLYPAVYDKPKTIETIHTGEQYKYHESMIFRGKASVTNGEFSFSFIVPKNISYQTGFGKISYYAEDGNIDAHGYDDQIIIGGTATDIPENPDKPKLSIYMNDTTFKFGGLTDENPVLLVHIKDELGINMTGAGIGQDLTATLNKENTVILNDHYETKLDTYQEGIIRYPFYNLSEGLHRVNVKVWNVANISNESYTEFVVAKSVELAIQNLINYPNPFSDKTTISFEHNQQGKMLSASIHIYNTQGAKISALDFNIDEATNTVHSLKWDGTNETGTKLDPGVYIYKLLIRSESGSLKSKDGKLIIIP